MTVPRPPRVADYEIEVDKAKWQGQNLRTSNLLCDIYVCMYVCVAVCTCTCIQKATSVCMCVGVFLTCDDKRMTHTYLICSMRKSTLLCH